MSHASRVVLSAAAILLSASLLAAEENLAELGYSKEAPKEGPSIKTDRGYMVAYKMTIPGTDVVLEMLPIPGGKFKVGSPAGEAGRSADEGPQVEIEVAPFWMAKTETTWEQYKAYMAMTDVFKGFQTNNLRAMTAAKSVDAVTAPSNLYDPSFTFEKGDDPAQPAVTMSHFAARQYTKWLSLLTAHSYRLPSETEWEYACRAGSTTAYSFGDDAAKLDDYAWHAGNSDDTTHLVGEKKPNPWGLHDMHGNVAEWVLDEFDAAGYKRLKDGTTAADSILWPTKLYPRVYRGGSWDTKAPVCRSAARRGSNDKEWHETDPNQPKSPWWFTDGPALGVGFRVIRQPAAPTAEQKKKYWEADLTAIADAAAQRVGQGRGSLGWVDTELPKAMEELKKLQKPKRR